MPFTFNPPTGQERTGLIFNKPDPGLDAFLDATSESIKRINPAPSISRFLTMQILDRTDPEILSPEEATDRFAHPDLTFDEPISRGRAQFIFDLKIEEDRFNETISLGRTSPFRAVAGFAQGLAVSFLDPPNIAVGLIPVFSQAKYLAMVKKAGGVVAGTRPVIVPAKTLFTVGATEGFVGNALVEPFVYLQAQNEQANYTFVDTLYNLGAGTALGAAIRIPAGKLKAHFDRIQLGLQDASPATLHNMFAQGIVDVARDNPISGPGKIAMLDPVLMRRSSFGGDISKKVQALGERIDDLRITAADNGIEGQIDLFLKQARRIKIDAEERGFIPKRLSAQFDAAVRTAMDNTEFLRAAEGTRSKGMIRRNELGQQIRRQIGATMDLIDGLVAKGDDVRRTAFSGPKRIREMNRKQVLKALRKFDADLEDDIAPVSERLPLSDEAKANLREDIPAARRFAVDTAEMEARLADEGTQAVEANDTFGISTRELKEELNLRESEFRTNPLDRENRIDPEVKEVLLTEPERLSKIADEGGFEQKSQGAILEHIRQFSGEREATPEHVKLAEMLSVDAESEIADLNKAMLLDGSDDMTAKAFNDQLSELNEEFVAQRKGPRGTEALAGKDLDVDDLGLSIAEKQMYDSMVEPKAKNDAILRAIDIASGCLKKNV